MMSANSGSSCHPTKKWLDLRNEAQYQLRELERLDAQRKDAEIAATRQDSSQQTASCDPPIFSLSNSRMSADMRNKRDQLREQLDPNSVRLRKWNALKRKVCYKENECLMTLEKLAEMTGTPDECACHVAEESE